MCTRFVEKTSLSVSYIAEPLYTSFHDEEWGVPVHDDVKLLELLVYSQALAELSWPLILSKRAVFRYQLNQMCLLALKPYTISNIFLIKLWIVFQKGF